MITILAEESNNALGQKLYEIFQAKNIESDYISLEEVEIKPCYSCGGCTYKSYGKCVVRDDGDWILPKIIQSDTLVVVTPITFGGYSFKVKRVLDKIALIGDRHYQVVNRELAKGGFQGNIANLFCIGVKDGCSVEESAAFEMLVREFLIIIASPGKPYVVDTQVEMKTLENMVKEMSI